MQATALEGKDPHERFSRGDRVPFRVSKASIPERTDIFKARIL